MMPDHRGLSHVFGIPRAKVEILVTATSEGDPVLAIGGVVPLDDRIKHTHRPLAAWMRCSAMRCVPPSRPIACLMTPTARSPWPRGPAWRHAGAPPAGDP